MRLATNLQDYFTVDLQGPQSYSIVPIIITVLVLFASFVALLFIYLVKKAKQRPKKVFVPKKVKLPLPVLKEKYLYMTTELEDRFRAGKIDEKFAYEELSSLTRHFVFDATDVKVQNYSLEEIARMGMPGLNELIKECYPPEFKPGEKGDILASLDHARRIVAQWN
ncbi:MAG: hypothetical protein KBS85_04325 [Lachnospiraceae bacterium]|nr:hypothetical protein [Candidatus Merdinaster equi]